MSESKSSTPPKSKSTTADPNKGEFVTEGEAAQEAGYWGTRDNPNPDEAYALTTGPDSPVEDARGNPVDVEALAAEQAAAAEKK